ncbi:tetratricopeptide repeat protein [Vallitaleaceae bacterium 9-2]
MNELDRAIKYRENGQVEEAIDILKLLLNKDNENAEVNYQLAWCYDVLEYEKEAVAYYEKAISLGLSEEDQVEAIIGLASTYRTIGQYNESKTLLESSIDKYDNKALEVFYAMTLYNLKEYEKSVSILLKLLANSSSDKDIEKFNRAISFYSDDLNRVW